MGYFRSNSNGFVTLDALCALTVLLILFVLLVSLGSPVVMNTRLLERLDLDTSLRMSSASKDNFYTAHDPRAEFRSKILGLYEFVHDTEVFRVHVAVDELSRSKFCQFTFSKPYTVSLIREFPSSALPVDALLFDTDLFIATDATSTFSDPDLFQFKKERDRYELVSSIDTGYGSARLAYHQGLIHVAQNFASHQFDMVNYRSPQSPYIISQVKLLGSAVARGKSIIRIGSYVYIGTTHNPDGPELFAYDLSGEEVKFIDSLEIGGSVNDLASANQTIFAATTYRDGELMLIALDRATGEFKEVMYRDIARGSGSVRTLGVSAESILVGLTVGTNELKRVDHAGQVLIERDIDTTVDDVVTTNTGWIVAINRTGEEIQEINPSLDVLHTISLGSRIKALRCHKDELLVISNNSPEIRLYSNL